MPKVKPGRASGLAQARKLEVRPSNVAFVIGRNGARGSCGRLAWAFQPHLLERLVCGTHPRSQTVRCWPLSDRWFSSSAGR